MHAGGDWTVSTVSTGSTLRTPSYDRSLVDKDSIHKLFPMAKKTEIRAVDMETRDSANVDNGENDATSETMRGGSRRAAAAATLQLSPFHKHAEPFPVPILMPLPQSSNSPLPLPQHSRTHLSQQSPSQPPPSLLPVPQPSPPKSVPPQPQSGDNSVQIDARTASSDPRASAPTCDELSSEPARFPSRQAARLSARLMGRHLEQPSIALPALGSSQRDGDGDGDDDESFMPLKIYDDSYHKRRNLPKFLRLLTPAAQVSPSTVTSSLQPLPVCPVNFRKQSPTEEEKREQRRKWREEFRQYQEQQDARTNRFSLGSREEGVTRIEYLLAFGHTRDTQSTLQPCQTPSTSPSKLSSRRDGSTSSIFSTSSSKPSSTLPESRALAGTRASKVASAQFELSSKKPSAADVAGKRGNATSKLWDDPTAQQKTRAAKPMANSGQVQSARRGPSTREVLPAAGPATTRATKQSATNKTKHAIPKQTTRAAAGKPASERSPSTPIRRKAGNDAGTTSIFRRGANSAAPSVRSGTS